MKLEQIDWVKELEEDEELVEWLEDMKDDSSIPSYLSDRHRNWWERFHKISDPSKAREVRERQNNIVFKGLMKKLNR